MKQLVLGFANEREAAGAVPLDPAIQERLVTLMAAAILAVVDDGDAKGKGGRDDADASEQQDRAAAPESKGGDLHAPIHRPSGP
jgi:hypothetical protein